MSRGLSKACHNSLLVMKQLDSIEELYNMYSEEENTPRIIEVVENKLDLDFDLEDGPVDLYLKL